jgi:F0F1-type ATP synthase assembly protein I
VRVVRVQALTTIAVAALSLIVGGWPAAGSALFGAGVAWVTTFYASSRARVPEYSAGAALRRVLVGEFIKVVATIALFAVAARVPHLVWPALLCGYAAALVASWLPWMRGGERIDGCRTG